jgi:hypothetical protein
MQKKPGFVNEKNQATSVRTLKRDPGEKGKVKKNKQAPKRRTSARRFGRNYLASCAYLCNAAGLGRHTVSLLNLKNKTSFPPLNYVTTLKRDKKGYTTEEEK